MNFQDPLLWTLVVIAITMTYFHFAQEKKEDIVEEIPKQKKKYGNFEDEFNEIADMAMISSNKLEKDEVTRRIYLYKNQYKDNQETRFNVQILEGLNNRVNTQYISQYQFLN